MPISAAAMSGIQANGHRWKHELRLSDQTNKLGEPDDLTVGDLEGIRDEIVRRVRVFIDRKGPETDMGHWLAGVIVDFEMVDGEVQELRNYLNDLYDEFDYWRVCVL